MTTIALVEMFRLKPLFHSLLLSLLFATGAQAQWTGWPCPTNTMWGAVSSNNYFSQLWSGLVERCVAVNIPAPVNVVTGVTQFAGWSNDVVVVTNGGVVTWVTNASPLYNTVSLTNQFTPFTYSWSNGIGAGVATCSPAFHASWIIDFDCALSTCLTWYVRQDMTNASGTYDDWFRTLTNHNPYSKGGAYNNLHELIHPPMWKAPDLFSYAGVGVTNGNGFTYFDQNLAYWTASEAVPVAADWVLASIASWSNNAASWVGRTWTVLPSWMHSLTVMTVSGWPPTYPVIRYVQAGTNAPTVTAPIALTLTGYGLVSPGIGDARRATNETVVFTSTSPVPCSIAWHEVTLSCTNTRPNSNDAFRVAYTNLPRMYWPFASGSAWEFSDTSAGDPLLWESGTWSPYMLSAVMLNERKAVLDKLVWSSNYLRQYRYAAPGPYQWIWAGTKQFGGYVLTATNAGYGTALLYWSNAKTVAENSWPTNTGHLLDLDPNYVYGSSGAWVYSGSRALYKASISKFNWRIYGTNASTAYYDSDYYYHVSAPHVGGTATWTNDTVPALSNAVYTFIGTNAAQSGYATMSSDALNAGASGLTNKPPWCAEPTSLNPVTNALGWEVYGVPIVVFKWDGTNGFKYK